MFSSLQQISSCERTTCLLDQSSMAKIAKIDDRIIKVGNLFAYEDAVGMTHTTSLNPNANLIRTGILQRSTNLSEDPRLADFDGSVRTFHHCLQYDGNSCSLCCELPQVIINVDLQ